MAPGDRIVFATGEHDQAPHVRSYSDVPGSLIERPDLWNTNRNGRPC